MSNIDYKKKRSYNIIYNNIINKLKNVNKSIAEKIPSKCTVLPSKLFKFKSIKDNNFYLKIFQDLIVFMKKNYNMDVDISKYDLFHGHLYLNKKNDLLILFHIREYPQDFPANLGYCQKESNIKMDETFKHRNIRYNLMSESFEVLYPIKSDITNTIRESTLGKPIIDLYLLDNKNVYASLR
tara:strand:+ start:155 stop:700 length:546 start_codon:yes stop_codon:yes gene_type:complete